MLRRLLHFIAAPSRRGQSSWHAAISEGDRFAFEGDEGLPRKRTAHPKADGPVQNNVAEKSERMNREERWSIALNRQGKILRR
jgi:hypothetical protein